MVLKAQQRRENEVMVASGETSDGSVRTNDKATKTLLDDINSEDTIKSAESLSCEDHSDESHVQSLDAEILGDSHQAYKKQLRNVVDETEVD